MYDIYAYYIQTFLIPSGILLLEFVLFCIASFVLARFIANKSLHIVHILIYIVVLATICMISFLALTNLANGGGAVSQEKETDALIAHGYVESIYSPSRRILLWFKRGESCGADIVIDGEQYFIVSTRNFEEGDYVAISYLPKSHFILQMVDVSEQDEVEIKRVLDSLYLLKADMQTRRTLLQKLWENKVYILFFFWFVFFVVLNVLDPLSWWRRKP